MRLTVIPQFVETSPDQLDDGVIYISQKYGTAMHKCCCGCGEEVVTPLTPADWRLRVDGLYVTLTPSIGNWNFPCKSHYWIRRNRVDWAGAMTPEEVREVQEGDRITKEQYVAAVNARKLGDRSDTSAATRLKRFWRWFKNRWKW